MKDKYKPVNITLPRDVVKLIVDSGCDASLDDSRGWEAVVSTIIEEYYQMQQAIEDSKYDDIDVQ
jgi:hypothetical protein